MFISGGSFCDLWRRGAMTLCILVTASACAARGDEVSGIRQLGSKHLLLLTDFAASDEIDALPELFDQAFPQWCSYFGVDEKRHEEWKVRVCLMKSPERFRAAGLLPDRLPEFAAAYSAGDQIWLLEQTSNYYLRHLLLHEGTHAFMDQVGGGKGPPWYCEGMAELLATHRLADGRLTLRCLPTASDEVPQWGRIEIVQAAYADRHALSLDKIFAYDTRSSLENQSYGWCWAAAAFFDCQPRYRDRFRKLADAARDLDFADQFQRAFAGDWPRIRDEWQLFVANLDYGYDFERMAIEPVPGQPLDGSKKTEIAADHGWQSSGVRVEAGQKYGIRATGRYQIGKDNQQRVWWCEPGGVTIRYYYAQPLGILVAAVRSDDPQAKGASGLLRPIVIGLGASFTAHQSGTLYLRVNDSAGSLADNAGSLSVEIARQ